MIKSSDVKASATIASEFKGPILLHMVDQNGYGDVSLAIKVAKFLFKKYPQAVIWISGKMESFEKIQEIDPDFLDYNLNPRLGTVLFESSDFFTLRDETDIPLEIETAIFNNSLRKAKRPQLFIGEYGSYLTTPYALINPDVIHMSGNLGKGYPGILIEPDLKKFSQLSPNEKMQARAKILEGNALDKDDQLLKKQLLQDTDPTKFVAQNGCAFAYYNWPVSYKRAAIAFAASNDSDHANFFVSANDKQNKAQSIFTMLKDNDFQLALKQLGYTKISFYNAKGEEDSIVLNTHKPNEREFRVFQRSRFHHDLMLDLMRLSDVCGVAGDQSLTEAISLGAIPIPEEWHCQVTIIGQMAEEYYNGTVMAGFHNCLWQARRETDIDRWLEAGKILKAHRSAATVVIKKIQEEANLYNALDYRLNGLFDKPQQEKIDHYNQLFIKELKDYASTLKKDKKVAFSLATEIAKYLCQTKPSEPLTMNKILLILDTHIGKRMAHIDSIRYHTITANDTHLIREQQSHSFIKRTLSHQPSGNSALATRLQNLYQESFSSETESWLTAEQSNPVTAKIPQQ
ncbi:Uncharacterised protein [Legionella donaldsonii]|uniref:Uncharacterized protein n=1 Tax=Legionella donaldsonii TaxID=45060 RepID=A0A378J1Y5_9GAMM|nr:hypothetical protein [Legionella donaldsonii]STX40961.1 Uncharacterised protein [Legionella donaldsonii]